MISIQAKKNKLTNDYIKIQKITKDISERFKEIYNINLRGKVLNHFIKLFLDSKRPALKKNLLKLYANKSKLKVEHIDKMLAFTESNPKDGSSPEYFKIFYTDWEEAYKKRIKLSSNTLQSFKEKYGEEEGEIKYKECNKRKRRVVENFIAKYGQSEGLKKYESFCKRNKGNHSLERKIELYGVDEGHVRYHLGRTNLKNKRSDENLARLYGEENVEEIKRNISKKLSESAKHIKNSICKIGSPAYFKALEKNKINLRKYYEDKNYADALALAIYDAVVRTLTHFNFKKLCLEYGIIKPKGYALDHIISVKYGFVNNIPPEVISSIFNFQFLPNKINNFKRENCYSIIEYSFIKDFYKKESEKFEEFINLLMENKNEI